MRLLPHIRKQGSRWLCATCWLPADEGAGPTPREAYESWKQVHFATPTPVVVNALLAYRAENTKRKPLPLDWLLIGEGSR